MNFFEIVGSYARLINPSPEEKKVADERAETCYTCEHKTAFMCGKCNCPIAAKVYSKNNTCPVKKWKQ
jgi:hypothetical protein